MTSLESFNSLKFWYDFIKKEIGKEIVLGLAGNKTDLIFENDFDEEVSPEKGKEFAQKIGASFALISAKESSKEITALFDKLLMRYLNNKDEEISLNSTIKLNENSSIDNEINLRKNECCLGKRKKTYNLNMIFIGCSGVGKTSIIKTLKGNNDILNLPHTKKNYNENIKYTKHGTNITVFLKDTNGNDYSETDLENDIKNNKVFFIVFDMNKITTLYAMEKFIKKIVVNRNKVYLLAYNNPSKEVYRSESECLGEIEAFAKKYECDYEFISIEDIYKLKALIIENIGKYLKTVGF
jgi:GTPase SAR1 family protein